MGRMLIKRRDGVLMGTTRAIRFEGDNDKEVLAFAGPTAVRGTAIVERPTGPERKLTKIGYPAIRVVCCRTDEIIQVLCGEWLTCDIDGHFARYTEVEFNNLFVEA